LRRYITIYFRVEASSFFWSDISSLYLYLHFSQPFRVFTLEQDYIFHYRFHAYSLLHAWADLSMRMSSFILLDIFSGIGHIEISLSFLLHWLSFSIWYHSSLLADSLHHVFDILQRHTSAACLERFPSFFTPREYCWDSFIFSFLHYHAEYLYLQEKRIYVRVASSEINISLYHIPSLITAERRIFTENIFTASI